MDLRTVRSGDRPVQIGPWFSKFCWFGPRFLNCTDPGPVPGPVPNRHLSLAVNLTVVSWNRSFIKYSTTFSCKIKVWECISKVDDKEMNSDWRVLKLCKSTFDFQVQKYLLHWLKIPRAFRNSRLLIKLIHVIILMAITWLEIRFLDIIMLNRSEPRASNWHSIVHGKNKKFDQSETTALWPNG